jgi:hypothetical protein
MASCIKTFDGDFGGNNTISEASVVKTGNSVTIQFADLCSISAIC